MVVTHLFQVMAFVVMEPPTALEPRAISEEKNKVFRSMLPVDPANVVRGQFTGYRETEGVARDSDTETFIALKVGIDNWRWAGVPIYLRTGKRMAEGMRIISIAFKEAPRTMFPPGSGVGSQGPDHLTFDLADNSKVSLSFYGKRPGPGMKLDKLSMQFSTQEVDTVSDVLEAYERLILDAMRGDHTLFTTAEGIESLWERSADLLADPPPAKSTRRDVGTQRDPSADRAERVAAAVRAGVARGQEQPLIAMRHAGLTLSEARVVERRTEEQRSARRQKPPACRGLLARAKWLLGLLEDLDEPPALGGRQRTGLHQRNPVADTGDAVLVVRLHLRGGADDLAVERVPHAVLELDHDGLLHLVADTT